MKRGKVLITDTVHQQMFDGLEALGFMYDYLPEVTLPKVHEIIHQYKGVIVNSKITADKTLLDKANELCFIARLGSGMEIIDQPYAHEKGIHVINSPEGNRNAVAEHALGMLLALANNFVRGDKEVRNKSWNREKNRGFELEGKTMGLIGFGHTGSSLGKKLAGLNMEILAYDKYKINYTKNFENIKAVPLSVILQQADIISFHLPLNQETKYFVNSEFMNSCKKGLVIINTSRGGVLNTNDLIDALNNGQVAAAALDVFENEKPATFTTEEHLMYNRLYEFENVILSPHVAGWTKESKLKLSQVILEKLALILK